MLNHQINLYKPKTGRDALNQPLVGWDFVRDVFANVRFQTGAEVVRANAETSITKASIRVRAALDIDSTWRVEYKQWTFEIKGDPLPDNENPEFVFLVCEAVK